MMEVAFVTNGNNKLGYGHVARTKLLCRSFQEKGVVTQIFVPKTCTYPFEESVAVVRSFSYGDLGRFIQGFDIAIIDCVEEEYDDLAWLAETRLYIVSITLFMFDLSKRFEHLSFFPSVEEPTIKTVNKRTTLFAGRNYVTFRDEFENVRFSVREDAKKILITMGGTDPFGLTLKALYALAKDPGFEITVLLSQTSRDFKAVQEYVSRYSQVRLLSFVNNVAETMAQHDLAVINGGLTRYEACVIGIPFLALSIHSKQFDITQQFVERGIGVNLGVYNEVYDEQIYDTVSKLLGDGKRRRAMSTLMRTMFDTGGAKRIYNIVAENFAFYEKNDKMGEA